MDWKLIFMPIALAVYSLGPFSRLQAWQSPPDQDASMEAILDFYVQSYGKPSQLQNLKSFEVKWDIKYRSSAEPPSASGPASPKISNWREVPKSMVKPPVDESVLKIPPLRRRR